MKVMVVGMVVGMVLVALTLSFEANAAEWICSTNIVYNTGPNTPKGERFAMVVVRADSANHAAVAAKRGVWRTVKLAIPKAVWLTDLSSASCEPDKRKDKRVPPPSYNAKRQDPEERSWYCHVKTTWHHRAKRGNVSESLYVTAPTEAAAMGAALIRIQGRVKAIFADKDKAHVTFTSTSVKCS